MVEDRGIRWGNAVLCPLPAGVARQGWEEVHVLCEDLIPHLRDERLGHPAAPGVDARSVPTPRPFPSFPMPLLSPLTVPSLCSHPDCHPAAGRGKEVPAQGPEAEAPRAEGAAGAAQGSQGGRDTTAQAAAGGKGEEAAGARAAEGGAEAGRDPAAGGGAAAEAAARGDAEDSGDPAAGGRAGGCIPHGLWCSRGGCFLLLPLPGTAQGFGCTVLLPPSPLGSVVPEIPLSRR